MAAGSRTGSRRREPTRKERRGKRQRKMALLPLDTAMPEAVVMPQHLSRVRANTVRVLLNLCVCVCVRFSVISSQESSQCMFAHLKG